MSAVEATNGSSGWADTFTGVLAGESLILAMNAENAAAGVPGSASLAVSDQDGNFTQPAGAIFNSNDRHCEVQALHGASAADHGLSCADSGLTSETWMAFRVSGLANAAAEDTSTNENASGTAHSCGSIDVAGPALIVGVIRTAGSKGTVLGANGFTALEGFGSRSIAVYRVVTTGGTYTPSCTTSVAGASTGSAAAFADAAAGGGSILLQMMLHSH